MDLRQLRTFLQVAETGSITKASERLRIAQPALSRQIYALEHELETPLFLRHGRGMNLTVSFEADGLTMLKDLVLRGLGCTV